jgi:uncharacterized NAD(P)/FAD-binding protein YdhS
MPGPPREVAIIGGGAAGGLTALHLLRRAPLSVRVTVVEPRCELGQGEAYGTTDPGHLLNTRSERLSAWEDHPSHFAVWAARHGGHEAFLPRARYGEYLRSLLHSVEHVHALAVDVLPGGERLEVALSDGRRLNFDRVVLAPGSSPPMWPKPLVPRDGRWITNPWAPGALDNPALRGPVLLVGTGLTAVDVALTLQTLGTHEVIATSRHGLLPGIHGSGPRPALDLKPPGQPTARSLLAWFRAATRTGNQPHDAVDALRHHADQVWAALPDVERRRLLRHLYRRWEISRHRMAPAVADSIFSMQRTGQLSVVPGGVRSTLSSRQGISVTLADRRIQVSGIVNCTGPALDVRATSHRLVRRLLDRRLVRPGPLHLGLETASDGRVPGTDDRLWLIGPLRRGGVWETTAIPEIRGQAESLAQSWWPDSGAAPD